jgi:trehalose 6-phosphate phosphatase
MTAPVRRPAGLAAARDVHLVKNLLARRHERTLRDLARSPALLAFDFDGTLAPIVADRHAAGLAPRTRRLLERLCRLLPCAVISGRSLADLSSRVAGIPVAHLVGSHGTSLSAPTRAARYVATTARQLRRALAGTQGVDIEEAGLALALHYRNAPERRLARSRINRAVRALPAGMRVVPGKMVVNLVPVGLPHKGDALRALLRHTGLTRALYVGDDRTDEDAFALAPGVDVISVRVGRAARSAAEWYVPSQGHVDALLERLLQVSAGHATPRPLGVSRRAAPVDDAERPPPLATGARRRARR